MVRSDEKEASTPRISLNDTKKKPRYVLVIHGGAETMPKEGATPEQVARYKSALSRALEAGYAVLKDGGEAMDAAVAAVSSMEGGLSLVPMVSKLTRIFLDCPLFNAGRGAVFNVEGKVGPQSRSPLP